MSMEIQLVASLIFILILSWMASKLFPVTKPLNSDRISFNFNWCFPETPIEETLIGQSGQVALVKIAGGVGLVLQMGDRVVCREVKDLSTLDVMTSGSDLVLTLKDFSLPTATLSLSNEDLATARNWLAQESIEEQVHAT